jgi:uncharacterized protein YaaW (UPF0174 family)
MKKQSILSPHLVHLFQVADDEDLSILADYVTDSGKGRLTLDADVCKSLNLARQLNNFSAKDRDALSREILAFGGNTLTNALRSIRSKVAYGGLLDKVLPNANRQVGYIELVRDVASKMDVKLPKDVSLIDAETMLLQNVMQRAFERMTPAERDEVLADLGANASGIGVGTSATFLTAAKLGGFRTYQIATIVANGIAKAVLGRGLSFKTVGLLMKSIRIATGPIGWAVTGLWTIADLAAPAYRVTIPAAIQIAYIRQKLLFTLSHRECECGTAVPVEAKFCPSCGTAMKVTA